MGYLPYHNKALSELTGRLKKTQQRVDTLYDEKLDGNITPEFYERKFKQYSEELDTIITSTERHKNANLSYVEIGSHILDLTQQAKRLYTDKATKEQKRKLLNIVFKQLLIKDKIVTPVFNEPFGFIAERIKTINSERVTLERNISGSKAVIVNSELNSENLLPVGVSNAPRTNFKGYKTNQKV